MVSTSLSRVQRKRFPLLNEEADLGILRPLSVSLKKITYFDTYRSMNQKKAQAGSNLGQGHRAAHLLEFLLAASIRKD